MLRVVGADGSTDTRTRTIAVKVNRGAWLSGTGRDAVDASLTSKFAVLPGEWIGEPDWLADDEPRLFVRCTSKGKADIIISVGGYLAANFRSDRIATDYSFDRGDMRTANWYESNNNEALFADSTPRWAARLRQHPTSTFTIRIYDRGGDVYGIAMFELDGFAAVAEPVLQECRI